MSFATPSEKEGGCGINQISRSYRIAPDEGGFAIFFDRASTPLFSKRGNMLARQFIHTCNEFEDVTSILYFEPRLMNVFYDRAFLLDSGKNARSSLRLRAGALALRGPRLPPALSDRIPGLYVTRS